MVASITLIYKEPTDSVKGGGFLNIPNACEALQKDAAATS
jgi:hypothetical protein